MISRNFSQIFIFFRQENIVPSILGIILLILGMQTAHGKNMLSLEEAVTNALQANPQLQSVRLESDYHLLERNIASAHHYPTIDLGASYFRYSDPSLVHPIGETGAFPPLDKDIVNTGLSLRMPLYAGGKLVAGESLATHNEQDALQMLRSSEQDLIFNVVITYAKVLQLGDLYTAQTQRLRGLEAESVEISRKLEEGRSTRLDSLRVQAQLSRAQVDQAATAQAERDARSLLAGLMNRPRLESTFKTLPELQLVLPDSAEQVAQQAYQVNPLALRASAQLESAEDRVAMARGEQRVQVDLIANAQSRRGGDWEGRDDWDIGLSLNIPLFDGGIRKSRTGQANARRIQAQQQYLGVMNDINTEAQTAYGSLKTAKVQVNSAKRGLAESEEAMRIETQRYRSGRSTITDLLSAEAAHWTAIALLNQTEFDEFVAKVRLLKVMGELIPALFKYEIDTSNLNSANIPGDNSLYDPIHHEIVQRNPVLR